MEESVNEVRLIGRVSNDPEERTLPSGDSLVSFRLIVQRPPAARKHSAQTVDTIECVAWTAQARRAAQRRRPGEVVEVEGALRRRFTRTSGTPQSWVSVEIGRCRRA